MSYPGKMLKAQVNGNQTFQTIDGFGVNINSKYWKKGQLIPAMDLLLDDLGATIYRIDIYGKSNWIDPDGSVGSSSLNPENLARLYQGEIFQDGWGMMRYLNSKNIEPYLTASGDVPKWMLGPDRKSLIDHEAFCEMLASMVEWAKTKENLKFRYFGPLNETDIGSPEGPSVTPTEFVKVCEVLDAKLTQKGLEDIQLVVAEQADFNTYYLRELLSSRKLAHRIGVFSMHDYADYPPEVYTNVTDLIRDSHYADRRLWMGEFGDLDQTGDMEWYVAWVIASRLLDQLSAGFNASLVWDAFDNYHDHNEAWTIYGLLRTGLKVHTPKKRYYACKQVFRFVPSGFTRLGVDVKSPDIRLLAFANPDRTQITLVGMNLSTSNYYLDIQLDGFPEELMKGKVSYFRTSEVENCYMIGKIPVTNMNYPFTGIAAHIPSDCIFTLTTL